MRLVLFSLRSLVCTDDEIAVDFLSLVSFSFVFMFHNTLCTRFKEIIVVSITELAVVEEATLRSPVKSDDQNSIEEVRRR